MSMKKADLEKNMAKKITGNMKAAGVPDRFAFVVRLADDAQTYISAV